MKSKVFILAICLIFCGSCKDECKNQLGTSADFDIETLFAGHAEDEYILVNSDTVRKGAVVRFKAKDSTAQYEWKIGHDPRKFSNQSVSLEFDIVGTIPITLMVQKMVDKKCFPNDDGKDTIQKSFTVVDKTLAPIRVGQILEGYVTSRPQEIFRITLQDDISVGPFLNNFPNGCFRPLVETSRGHLQVHTVNYRYFRFGTFEHLETKWACPVPYGWGKVDTDQSSVKLTYQIQDTARKKIISETFIGKILQ